MKPSVPELTPAQASWKPEKRQTRACPWTLFIAAIAVSHGLKRQHTVLLSAEDRQLSLKEKKGPRLLPKSCTEHRDGTHARSFLLVAAHRSRRIMISLGKVPRYMRV